jgi:hypothetical protein
MRVRVYVCVIDNGLANDGHVGASVGVKPFARLYASLQMVEQCL